MPVFNPKPTTPPVAVDSPTRALAPENQNIIVDSRYTPMHSLLTQIEGTPWAVDYYSQVIDKDTAISGQQVNRLGINQQYRLIKSFELRVNTPLSGSQDTESNSMILNGGANVFPSLIPNAGDMFLGDIGDGRLGVFQVTDVKRMSIMKNPVHEIAYQWVAYATTERVTDLNKKVVKQEVFVLDHLFEDKYPFVAVEEYEARTKLMRLYRELVPMYFQAFWDNEFTTLMVPDQDLPTYDPLLVKAVLSIVSTSDCPEVIKTRQLNCDGDYALDAVSIWTTLLERSELQLQRVFTRAATVSARAFPRVAFFESICQSGVAYVVYPIDPERSILPKKLLQSKALAAAVQRPDYDTFGSLLPVAVLSGLDEVDGHFVQPDIPAACATDFYVFTESFYDDQQANESRLENLVHDYLEKKSLDPAVLLKVATGYPGWAALDQFYYGPVLMLLMRCVTEKF
jgi:hypothetical protein